MMLCRDLLYWKEQLEVCDKIIDFLLEKPYEAAVVFVTFEHERGQRSALNDLSTGLIQAITNRSCLPKNLLFRGSNVLDVKEAPEHSDIIYEKMGLTNTIHQYIAQFETLLLSAVFLFVSVLLIMAARDSPTLVGVLIASSNILFPYMLNIGVAQAPYDTYSSQQVSVFVILCMVRIINTVFLTFFVQSFTVTLSAGSIQQLESILMTDAIVLPVMSILHPLEEFKRHVLARFAVTQAQANEYCAGEEVVLARKFSNMIKTLALALVYAPIYPSGLAICALSFLATYFADKYCLLRKWRPMPHVDEQLPYATVNSLAIIAFIHIMMASYFFASWGFDNVCAYPEEAAAAVGVNESVVASAGGIIYKFCRKEPIPFWPEVHEWMPPEQMAAVRLFRVLCVGVVGGTFLWVLLFSSQSCYVYLFKSTYTAVGDSQDIPFSKCAADVYLPSVQAHGVKGTLLACDKRCFPSRRDLLHTIHADLFAEIVRRKTRGIARKHAKKREVRREG
jgi:hypothetical protein